MLASKLEQDEVAFIRKEGFQTPYLNNETSERDRVLNGQARCVDFSDKIAVFQPVRQIKMVFSFGQQIDSKEMKGLIEGLTHTQIKTQQKKKRVYIHCLFSRLAITVRNTLFIQVVQYLLAIKAN